ncbi:hypothetical protein, partial [Novosphingobium indicum]|uniref:hypothetical protein n=1 Tax=Novosphingobium indicum TaxID=462949 RepID=UPI00166E18F5
MDAAELIWGWLNGLVRRAVIGVLFYLLFAIVCALLVVLGLEKGQGLGELDGLSREHSRFSEAFLDIAEHATEVAGSPSRAKAVIPRLSDHDPCAHWRKPMDMMRH